MTETQRYTLQKIGEQLAAIEQHLTDLIEESEDVSFCSECLAKHALALGGLTSEGTQFFPEDDDIFSKLHVLINDFYNDLPDFTKEKARQYYDKFRLIRKDMVAKHLLLGNSIENKPHTHIYSIDTDNES